MKRYLVLIAFILFCTAGIRAQVFTKANESVISFEESASRSVNWIDFDNDRDLDLFISNGKQGGQDNMLYRNDNGSFKRIYDVPPVQDNMPSDGSSWGDFDNDGLIDLCVVNWYNRPALLYKNAGGGNFTYLSSSIVSSTNGYSETCTWGDYNNDGLIDLFITNSAGSNHRNYLYANTGSGNFARIDTGIVVSEIGRARGANWIDIDNDRDLDLLVCRESGQSEYLYRNEGGGYFVKITDSPLSNAGGESWSASWGDYDNDGDFDVLVTNTLNQNNALFRNDGNFTFTRITDGVLVNDPGYNSVSGWGDYDNDGDIDMFITQAYVPPGFTQKVVNRLYRNMLSETGNASFEKITAGEIVSDSGYSYGFAWGDYDKDGDLDIAVANTFGESQKSALYTNMISNGNSHVIINCIGTTSNRSAIGTRVRVKAVIGGNAVWQVREVSGQSGYCGQNLQLHFGLGNASSIDSVIVEWPSGQTQRFGQADVNRSFTITEGGTIISVGSNSAENPESIMLYQNYPNPFNPVTRIEYDLPAGGMVSLSVTDITGKTVETIRESFHNAGKHTATFNGEGRTSGIYFLKLKFIADRGAGTQIASRKMVLLK